MTKYPTPVTLAFCSDNESIAQLIRSQLASIMDVQLIQAGRDSRQGIREQVGSFEGPIVLLISDNYLRSTMCMHQGLAMLNELGGSILPVVVPGFRKDLETGQEEEIHTTFERVTDIIQYINFWQDRYLDLRKQKREDPELDEVGFNQHLKIVREISSEAGEFLRLLRSTWHLSQEEFSQNNYEQLFIFLEEPALWEHFQSTDQPAAISTPDVAPDSDVEEEVAKELDSIPGVSLSDDNDQTEETTPSEESSAVSQEEIVEDSTESEPDTIEEEAPEELIEEEEDDDDDDDDDDDVPEPADDTSILINKAWNLIDRDHGPEGVTLLAAGVENYPSDLELRYHYALALAQERRVDGAREQVELILQSEPEHEAALFLAGEIADSLGEAEHARHYFEQVVALNADYPDAWYQLGVITLENFPDQKEEALRYFRKAAKKSKDNSDATYHLALLYSEVFNEPKKARNNLKKTIKRDPNHPFAHYDLALWYHRAEEYDRARQYYESAVFLNPELKTVENDAAFLIQATDAADTPVKQEEEKDTIGDLKKNIAQLEALITAREREHQSALLPGHGQTALISGATAGIGKATAQALAKRGYRIIITGRRIQRLEALAQAWAEQFNTEVLPLCFDVREPAAVMAAISGLPASWQQIDLLINNAGKAKGLSFIHEGELEHWEEMIDTNIKGLLYLSRAISPGMVARGAGHIINVCSTAGKEVYPKGNVYCATKFAVDALTKGMRIDLHTFGVRVSQVCPAHVEETEFAEVRFDGDKERAKIYEDFQPLTSSDVAETIAYIAAQPAHVNILEVVMQGTQQAHSMIIDRSGRNKYGLEEE